ncbi:MAG: acyltransferase [Terracidiphilus sp.]
MTPASPIHRPAWLPGFIPELDGLRGIAILAVVLYHCNPRLVGTWIHYGSLWGWSGVIVFFSLSGFLITTGLLGARAKPDYFHSFHARRVLRIWPVYLLVLFVCYWQAHWFVGMETWPAVKAAPWLAYLFFVQNLFHLNLPAAIGPTWALAIEEQYYFFWAPLVRWLRRPWMLAALLTGVLAMCPVMRQIHPGWLTPTHTLIHLDGIALGSLMAIGLCTLPVSRRTWLFLGLGAFVVGIGAAATVAGGTSLLDSALTLGFSGAILASIASTGALNPLSFLLRRGPLAYYGRISYGLYMTHIMVFIFFGWVDVILDCHGSPVLIEAACVQMHLGSVARFIVLSVSQSAAALHLPANLALVIFRLAASTAVATALWYGFEKQILKLKRYF